MDFVNHSALIQGKCTTDWLRDNSIISDDVVKLIHAAWNTHGIIAGGFGRLLARLLLNLDTCDDSIHVMKQRLYHGRDIDLFFNSLNDANRFIENAFKMPSCSIKPSYGKGAQDIKVKYFTQDFDSFKKEYFLQQKSCKLQVVTCNVGSIENVLSSFDIKNCMCGVNATRLTVSKEWYDLEQAKIIAIDKWNVFTPSRLQKYLGNNPGFKLEEKASMELVEYVLSLLAKSDETAFITKTGKKISKENLIYNIKTNVRWLTNEALVLAMPLLNEQTTYRVQNIALSTLNNRGRLSMISP